MLNCKMMIECKDIDVHILKIPQNSIYMSMSSSYMCKLTLTVFFFYLLQLSKWYKVSTGKESKNPKFVNLPYDFDGFNISPTDTSSEKGRKNYFTLELVQSPKCIRHYYLLYLLDQLCWKSYKLKFVIRWTSTRTNLMICPSYYN